jgi:hypothetical protein
VPSHLTHVLTHVYVLEIKKDGFLVRLFSFYNLQIKHCHLLCKNNIFIK